MQLPRLSRELVDRLTALFPLKPRYSFDLFLERKLDRPVVLVRHKTFLDRGLRGLAGLPLERRRQLLKKPPILLDQRVKLRRRFR